MQGTTPTPYRVSTITATGSIGCLINLEKLFENIDVVSNSDRILYVEFGCRKFDNSYCKGLAKKVIKVGDKSKRFDNQVTVLYSDAGQGVYVSAKIFKNGNLQMTGIKSEAQGAEVMRTVRDIVRSAGEKDPEVIDAGELLDEPANFSIRMINSDFKMGFPIRRDLLYKEWVAKYEHGCSYEPCIYQGVKIQYFYNTHVHDHTHERDGICRCSTPCILRRKNEEVPCRKVTIAVFQSGSVIITGGKTIAQVEEVYEFIKGILLEMRPAIEGNAPIVITPQESKEPIVKSEKIILKKSNIIYPKSYVARA